MNSGPTSERVYDAIKQRILSGLHHPGERLDPAALAETVSSSVTPVRDALNILTGQGLVVTGTAEGFHLPSFDEPGLHDLYAWHLEVLLLAIKAWPSRDALAIGEGGPADQGEGQAIARVSVSIAAKSANIEHLWAITRLNDRLNAVRLAEVAIVEGDSAEIPAIEAALERRDKAELSKHLLRYHRRRQRLAAEIVRACYRR